MIEINITLLMQVIGFFVLLFVLNGLLYKPVLNILEQRKERIDGSKKEAERLVKDVQDKADVYEKKLHEARVKGHEERQRIKTEGIEKERLILDGARKEAQESIANAKTKLNAEIKSIAAGLKGESATISREIAEKVIGRKVV